MPRERRRFGEPGFVDPADGFQERVEADTDVLAAQAAEAGEDPSEAVAHPELVLPEPPEGEEEAEPAEEPQAEKK